MVFDPIKFLDLAKELNDPHRNDQARYRSSISRAYYSAHLFTREKMKEIGIHIKIEVDENIGKMHKKVIDALRNKDDTLGGMLSALMRERHNADYKMEYIFDWYRTATNIQNAEFIIKEVDKFRKPGKR